MLMTKLVWDECICLFFKHKEDTRVFYQIYLWKKIFLE